MRQTHSQKLTALDTLHFARAPIEQRACRCLSEAAADVEKMQMKRREEARSGSHLLAPKGVFGGVFGAHGCLRWGFGGLGVWWGFGGLGCRGVFGGVLGVWWGFGGFGCRGWVSSAGFGAVLGLGSSARWVGVLGVFSWFWGGVGRCWGGLHSRIMRKRVFSSFCTVSG